MKSAFCGIAAAVLMLLAVFGATCINQEKPNVGKRFHQHLEERAFTPCSSHKDDVFCTHLPIVIIDTEGKEIPGKVTGEKDSFGQSVYSKADDNTDYINVSVSVIDNKDKNNHLTDKSDFTTRSLFRIRGNSSRKFEKSPYLLKFVDENGADNPIKVMGMDAHNEWALVGPYLDKSLVRNYMWYNISGEIMDYAPNVRYCEVFVNNDYRGLYLMTETVSAGKDEGRLQLKKTVKGNELSGFLLRIDRPTQADLETTRDIYSFSERLNLTSFDIAIRYPGSSNLTPERSKEIENEFSKFEKALYSYDYDTEDYGYQTRIDTDNFIDYYIINEFTSNIDAGNYSTYIYKEPNEKYKMCVWDFNNACNNYIETEFGSSGLYKRDSGYYYMIFRDPDFAEKVIKRYRELRKSVLSDDYLTDYIDSVIKWLGPAADRNYERWKDFYNENPLINTATENTADRNTHTTKEATESLKTWIVNRGAWLDRHIDALNFLSHPSRNKRWNDQNSRN